MATSLRILLIEDNPGDVTLLEESLKESGLLFELEQTAYLNVALSDFDWAAFDVVLLDLTLPDADWVETLSRLQHRVEHAPVVVLTGLDNKEVGLQAIRAGAQDYLIKGQYDSALLGRILQHARERFRLLGELKAARDREWRLANYDDLTRLPNRRLFEERLSETIAHAKRAGNSFAVLFIDLDRFKPINDSLGHDKGDELLRIVAHRLKAAVRAEDMVARLGGDEFLVLLRTLKRAEDAAIVVQKLIEQITMSIILAGREIVIGVSIGIAVFPIDGDRHNELIHCADLAMYQAKKMQGNSYQFYSASLGHQAKTRLSLESGLRQALTDNELIVHYQPAVAVSSGQVMALEALVRWQHPQQGLLAPTTFIPLAEETDLILALDAWMLQQACQQCQQWGLTNSSKANIAVNVNLSARHFRCADNIIALVSECLHSSRLPASQLELEVTETALIQQPEAAAQTLNKLRALGVRIALDDFGVGYSSLSYLKSLPLDTLKIDRTFLQQVPEDAKSTALLTTILQLAQTLNIQVIAEGVENPAQFDWLRHHGDCLVQGYALARPSPEPIFKVVLPSL